MKLLYLFVFLVLHTCFVDAVDDHPIQIPSAPAFPVEGNVFSIVCKTTGNLQNIYFVNAASQEIKNSTDNHRYITKTKEGSAEVITLTWNPLRLTDELKGVGCYANKVSYTYNLQLIPKVNKPSVTVEPSSSSTTKGSSVTLKCAAHMVWYEKWDFFELQWYFGNDSLQNSNYTIKKGVDKKDNKTSELIIDNIGIESEGVFRCDANIKFTKSSRTKGAFSNTSTITVDWPPQGNPPKEEVVRKNEETAVMECIIQGYPLPKLIWEKDDAVLTGTSDRRYSFSKSVKQDADNGIFTIKKVTYSDRGVYKCKAVFSLRNGKTVAVTKEFILRVRDPLGALWPAIGIIIEAIVLFFIIALYNCFKKPKHQDETDGKSHVETSPLVTGGPRVSYTTGEDNVRSRIIDSEKA